MAENIAALFSLKVFEYGVSFLTLPYLVRVLGPEKFGLVAFAQGVIQYFVLVTDYGFHLTASRGIARARNEAERGRIFAAVLAGKGLLLLLATAALAAAVSAFPAMRREWALYGGAYLLVVGNVLFPVWFFQGIEKMRYITIVNLIARLSTVLAIFCLVESEADYPVAALLQSSGTVIAGAAALGICGAKYRYVFVVPRAGAVKRVLAEGWDVFVSMIAINLYTASTVVILGMLTNPAVVGYFSAAQKLIGALTGLAAPVSQAIYPHVSRLAAQSKEETLAFLRKCLFCLGGANLAVTLTLVVFAGPIVRLLLGPDYGESIVLLRIMAALPVVIALSNVFGIQTMLPFGMQSAFSRIVAVSAALHLCLLAPLIICFSGRGAALALLVTECFVTVSMYRRLKKQGFTYLKAR